MKVCRCIQVTLIPNKRCRTHHQKWLECEVNSTKTTQLEIVDDRYILQHWMRRGQTLVPKDWKEIFVNKSVHCHVIKEIQIHFFYLCIFIFNSTPNLWPPFYYKWDDKYLCFPQTSARLYFYPLSSCTNSCTTAA